MLKAAHTLDMQDLLFGDTFSKHTMWTSVEVLRQAPCTQALPAGSDFCVVQSARQPVALCIFCELQTARGGAAGAEEES